LLYAVNVSERRVVIVGDSLFAETLAKILASAESATLAGVASTIEAASPLIEAARADAVIIAGIGQLPFNDLFAAHPDLPILCANLNTNTIQVITSKCISASAHDLLNTLATLPKRS
jgi:hypothetical protein